MSSSLIPIEKVNAIEIFTQNGMDALLKRIEDEVSTFVPDLDTVASRAQIATKARQVSTSKVFLEKARIALVKGWKDQAKVVDAEGKKAREFLDNLRDQIRKPLTDWEANKAIEEEEKRIADERAAELVAAEIEAYSENEMFDREQVIKLKEAEIAKAEEKRVAAEKKIADAEEKLRREAAEKIAAKERAANEERIRFAAATKAKREAAEAVDREIRLRQKAERDKREAAELANRYKAEALQRAKQQQLDAVEKERRRTEQLEADLKRAADERAADRKNRTKVNRKIVAALKAEGIEADTATLIIRCVAANEIPHMKIEY